MKLRFIFLVVMVFIVIYLGWLASPLFVNDVVNEDALSGEEVMLGDVTLMGNFVDADSFHKTSGFVEVISDGDF